MHFDTTSTSFENFDSGYVLVNEIAQTLAEAETDLNFMTTTLASFVKGKQEKGISFQKDLNYRTPHHYGEMQRAEIIESAKYPGISKAASRLISLKSKWIEIFKELNAKGNLNIHKKVGEPPLKKVVKLEHNRNNLWIKIEDIHKFLIKTNQIDLAKKIHAKNAFTSRDYEERANNVKPFRVWPWGGHTTYLLEVLSLTAEKFWRKYTPTDETTARKQDEVIQWILKEFGDKVSKANAYSIAKILRPDDLSKGRPKK